MQAKRALDPPQTDASRPSPLRHYRERSSVPPLRGPDGFRKTIQGIGLGLILAIPFWIVAWVLMKR